MRDAAFQPREPADTATAGHASDTGATTTITGTSTASPAALPDSSTQAAQPPPATPPQPSATLQPPAAQLAGAVASLHVSTDGTSHVTIRLDPAELGHLQIHISRATDGTASVDVTVERPDTLANLQSDLAHLHQALDRAGLPDQRSVILHLASQPDQAPSTTLGTSAGFTSQGGQQGAREHQHQQQPQAAAAASQPQSLPDSRPANVRSRAAAITIAGGGVNITA
jgi:flagellar hook-length control protein FliK